MPDIDLMELMVGSWRVLGCSALAGATQLCHLAPPAASGSGASGRAAGPADQGLVDL